MTSTRRLQLTAAFAAASVVLAVSSTVSALASPGSDAAPAAARAAVAASPSAPDPEPTAHPAPAVVVTPTPSPTPTPTHAAPSPTPPAATPSPTRTVTRVVTTVSKPAAKPTSRPTARKTSAPVAAAKAVTPRVITISRYVDAPGSQAAIDQCKLVLWAHTPLWLAGHNYCGYQWMAYVPTGATVRVTTGAAAGTFVVTGHLRLSRQGGAMPALRADLVLQTCVGSGTALTLLRRV